MLLTKHYSEPGWGNEHLTAVDAYALQHSDEHGPRSNAYHLMRLALTLENGLPSHIGARPPREMGKTFETLYRRFPHLEPPDDPGAMTVADVAGADSAEEHCRRVRAWGDAVWRAWESHHETARKSAAFLRERVRREP